MNGFTYNLPFTEDKFLEGIIFELKRNEKYDIAHLLTGASLSIETGGYSYYDGHWGRNDALAAYINFYVNPEYLELLENDETKGFLRVICHKLIPDYVGYDVKSVSFIMDLTKDYTIEDDLIADLEKQTERISYKVLSKLLPEDVKIKGYQMAEAYTYLYAVENSIRLFIENICIDSYGSDYFDKINVTSSMRRTIEERKRDAKSKKWLSVRGNSNLFYLDFKDLSSLIENNWEIFKNCFPSQEFITVKLKEMADCRNLIAHNSFINDTERNLIKTYYNVILKQISEKIK